MACGPGVSGVVKKTASVENATAGAEAEAGAGTAAVGEAGAGTSGVSKTTAPAERAAGGAAELEEAGAELLELKLELELADDERVVVIAALVVVITLEVVLVGGGELTLVVVDDALELAFVDEEEAAISPFGHVLDPDEKVPFSLKYSQSGEVS